MTSTRGIRIWHQSFTVLQDLGAYDAALKAHFRRVARPDTEIVMHGMVPGTYQTNYPGNDIRHAGLQHLHSMQFLRAGLRRAVGLPQVPRPQVRQRLGEQGAHVRVLRVGLPDPAHGVGVGVVQDSAVGGLRIRETHGLRVDQRALHGVRAADGAWQRAWKQRCRRW